VVRVACIVVGLRMEFVEDGVRYTSSFVESVGELGRVGA